MGALTGKQAREYTKHRAFTDPPVSAEATRRTVPQDVWRSLEIFPGLLTWVTLVGSVILSFYAPIVVAYFILLFDAYWLAKSVTTSHGLIHAYRFLQRDSHVNWAKRLWALDRSIDTYEETLRRVVGKLEQGRTGWRLALFNAKLLLTNRSLQQEYRELKAELAEVELITASGDKLLRPRDIYQLVIIATYTEDLDTLRPSLQAVADADYDKERLIVVLATEGRDKVRARANAAALRREFARKFGKFLVTEHPGDIVGETKGKGSNLAWAGRKAVEYIDQQKIKHEHVIVTTLDADHRPHPQYFSALTYHYVLAPHRKHVTWQPTPLFHNNLWDTAAINRVIATGSSFWHMIESTRSYRLRNFAAHSQSLPTIIDTDFWSVDTIVEDGQQYWRTYFAYHGKHYVVPIYVPVYQDAVLGDTYVKTLRGQYLQLRRWAWGASDFPYIVINSWRDKSIPWYDKWLQVFRYLEGHFTWATAPILITFVGWLPIILSPDFRDSLFGQTLAPTASLVLTMAMVGIVITIFISMLLLPKKPKRYSRGRTVLHVVQWVLMPITTILFSSLPAIESQTRLMFGKYLEFWVTPKATRSDKPATRTQKVKA